MKAVTLCLAATAFASVAALGQGQFVFNNRVLPDINAPFVYICDRPGQSSIGTNFSVQLFNTSGGTLVPLDPAKTTFRGAAGTPLAGYVNPTTETVPGVAPGGEASILLRLVGPIPAGGQDFGPYRVTLGGGTITPPNLPLGTSPLISGALGTFCVPEPFTAALALVGVSVILLVHRKRG